MSRSTARRSPARPPRSQLPSRPLGRPAGLSAEDLLGRLELDEGAREAIRARLEVSSAATADRVDASVLAGLAAHADDVCPSVAGGNQRLALALAGALDDPVRLGAPVERIAWSDDGADLAAAGTELRADRVVLAVPASVVERIAFDPPLPDRLATAFASVAYGHAAKLFVAAPPRCADERGAVGSRAVLDVDRDGRRRRPAAS